MNESKIRQQCPSCLKVLRIPSGFAGRDVSCPSCQVRLRVKSGTDSTGRKVQGQSPRVETGTIGQLVQWVSGGQEMFQTAKRVFGLARGTMAVVIS